MKLTSDNRSLPRNWEWKKLSEIAKILNGYSFKSEDFSDKNCIQSVKITNVGVRDFIQESSSLLPENFLEKYSEFRVFKGDIVIALTRTIISSGLKVAQVPNEYDEALLNQRVASIRSDSDKILGDFLFLYLCTPTVFEYVKQQANTLMQPNLSIQSLKSLLIPVPKLSEQKRIVAIVDQAFEAIDAAIGNTEKNLANARELFESYLNAVLTQEDNGWQETTLGTEINLMTGFPFKSAQYTDSDQSIRLLRGDNIVQCALRWDDVKKWPESEIDEFLTYQLKEGDVVLAMDRPWVKAGLKHAMISSDDLPCLLVQRTACLRATKNIHNRFLMYLIGSHAFTRHILSNQTGIGVPHISGKQIQGFTFLKPPVSKQKIISDNLDELKLNIQRLEAIYRQKLAALTELKQSILQKAFTGELTAD